MWKINTNNGNNPETSTKLILLFLNVWIHRLLNADLFKLSTSVNRNFDHFKFCAQERLFYGIWKLY